MTYQVQKALRNLKYILLNERSQPLKAKHCLISTSGHSGKEETGDSKRITDSRGGKGDKQVAQRHV